MTARLAQRHRCLTASMEAQADAAFLHLHKLRDELAINNENIAACRVDEAMECLTTATRMLIDRERLK